MKNFLPTFGLFLILCIPVSATEQAGAGTGLAISTQTPPKKRVHFNNVFKKTDFPFLYQPYLPDKQTECRTADDTWSQSLQLCFSPSGKSDSSHQLGRWNGELYLIKKTSTVAEFLFINPVSGTVFPEDELPSSELEKIQYFNDIRMFSALNAAIEMTYRALVQKRKKILPLLFFASLLITATSG